MNTAMVREHAKGFENICGDLRCREPMSRHTSWRVGGPAEYFFVPADRADLIRFLACLPNEVPLLWLGLGSNLLVRDGGFPGAVVCLHRGLSRLSREHGNTVHAEAGVTCAQVARFSVTEGFAGAEFLAGIPGTVGGALAMNAGAFGGETWAITSAVEVIDRRGRISRQPADAFEVGYRSVSAASETWFISADFTLHPDGKTPGRTKIHSLLAERAGKQPVQSANAGSVFRNPPGDYAGRLIEAAGLKGLRHGGAVVSAQHANFIINEGGATAGDIEALISEVQLQVADQLGVALEPEVRIAGVIS